MSATPEGACRVLLVDDVASLRQLVRLVLDDAPDLTVVAEASDGAEAVRLAADHQPDLVLLDLSMPGMDGLEALPRIREAAPTAAVAILSGFEASRVADTALSLGAVAYLEKGLAPSVLVERVREIAQGAGSTAARQGDGSGDRAEPGEPERISTEDLLRIVAHDLRGPVAAIIGFGHTLADSWDRFDDASRRTMVERMLSQGHVLRSMCDDLLDAHQADTGTMSTDVRVEDALPLVDRLADLLRPLAAPRAMSVVVEPDLPQVVVDAARLRQVLANLVLNAVRFSPPDEDIRLGVGAAAGGVVFEVADRGPGIPAEERHRVFGKYVRLGAGGPGTGLGLYVCAALVAAMDGRIWVDEHPGGGARFCCWFPSP